jgi:hypothetical protein
MLNQRLRISNIFASLSNAQAMIVIDFKMKFIPMYWRETTLQHFGKRGISWHGAMIYVPNEDSFDVYYVDCISENDMKQDVNLVIQTIDITLERLRSIRSDVQEVYFQSDNAKCYQGGVFAEAVHQVCLQQKFILKSYVQTETQDGKCSIDGHFAVGMRSVTTRVNEGYNASNPEELADALSSNGGVRNTDVILFVSNRKKVDSILLNMKKYTSTRWAEFSPEVPFHLYNQDGLYNYSFFVEAPKAETTGNTNDTLEEEDSEAEEKDDAEAALDENQAGLVMESLIMCKGITEVSYKVMDTTKQFTGIKHTTKVKYKSKTEKEVETKCNK